MATYVPAKKNTAFIMYIGLPDQSDQRLMKSSPTIAAGDFKVSIDGGALANLATLPTVTPAAGKMVKVSLSAAEMNGDNITVVCSDAAGAEWCDLVITLPTAARQIDDLAYPATSGRSMVVDAAGLVDSNVVKVGPTGAGTAQTAGDVIGDTNDIQTRLPAALVGGRMDSSVGAMATDTITSGALAASAVTEIQSGLATSAALATVQADSDDIQARLPATLSGGKMRSQVEGMDAGTVTAAAVATDAIDSDAIAASAVTEIQSGLATAAALATVQSDTDNIQTRLPAALVGGKMDSSLDAAGLQGDAVTEIQSGLATSAALATVQADTDNIQTRLPVALVGGRMDADVGNMQANTVNAAALAADAGAEIAGAVIAVSLTELAAIPGASPALGDALQLLYMALRNELDTTAVSKTIKNQAGAVIGTAVLSDDLITFRKTRYT